MKIIFTHFAQKRVQDIYNYYNSTISKQVAETITQRIFQSVKILKDNPNAGQIEEFLIELGLKHRRIVEGNYKIIYRIHDDTIYITDIFDTRQNPKKILPGHSA